MLSGDGVDEQALYRDAQPLRPRSYVFQFGHHRDYVSKIEIRARGKGAIFCPDAFDALAQSAARQADDLVAFGDQDAPNRKQRIEMARRGRLSNENFHAILSL